MTVFKTNAPVKPVEKPPTPRSAAQEIADKELGAALSPSFMGANLFTDDKMRQVSSRNACAHREGARDRSGIVRDAVVLQSRRLQRAMRGTTERGSVSLTA